MPTDHVVEHGHLGIPVRNEEQVVAAPSHSPQACLRYGERPFDFDRDGITGEERFRQPHQEDRALNLVRDVLRQFDSGHGDAGQLDASRDFYGAIPDGPFGVNVLMQVEPQARKWCRCSVVVHDVRPALDALRFGNELDV